MWADLAAGQRNGLAQLETRLVGRMDQIAANLGAKIDALDQRLTALEARVYSLEPELATFRRVASENFARIQRNFELLLADVRDPAHKARLDDIEARLVRLEQRVGLIPDE